MMDSPKTIIRIRHQSIAAYLTVIRAKVAEFGRDALTAYDEPQRWTLGFRCGDEVHVVGLNNIRAHYHIERILPNIPGLVSYSRNAEPTVSQEAGIKMFMDDCKKALRGE